MQQLQLQPTAIIVSGLSLAGLTEIGLLEALPKGALLGIIGMMFGIILFFARRDYNRINTTLEANGKTFSELAKKVDTNHHAVMAELNNCIKVPDYGVSSNRMHNRINKLVQRQTVVETKLGMHEEVADEHQDNEDES